MWFLFRRYSVIVSCAALCVGAIGCSSSTTSDSTTTGPKTLLGIQTLSNRADLISGGDALVEILLPPKTAAERLHVAVGGRDVSSEFAARSDGRIIGVISGLAEGVNLVTADLAGEHGASLTITSHKIGGPVISGPQVKPFVCATPTAQPAQGNNPKTNASGLSTTAIDDQCNIATEIKLYYHSTTDGCSNALPDPNPGTTPPTNPCFKPYDVAAPAPADLATITTDTGVTGPYIVRVERGTLNRGIFDIAVLFDPKKDSPKTGWKPYAPQAGWNGKVVYSFGASTGQPRLQFRSSQTWTDDSALSRGFLVAINSMTDSRFNSNRVVMSETVMMMKEKIIDTYGEVRYVIGNGCSGGSINQLTTASIFPGLLDGIQPTCTYPDAETTGIEVGDCTLLVNAYNSAAWKTLMTQENQDQTAVNLKKAAINGHVDQTGCHAWVNSFSNVGRPGVYIPIDVIDDATGQTGPRANAPPTNNCELPNSMIYDPDTNPTGIRCTGADHAVAIFGKVKDTNRARTTNDNVGVQYGLKALLAGAINFDEFATLNEAIGGVNSDDEFVAARSAADPDALQIAYRAGIVSDGQHLARTAIIDLRGYDDQRVPGVSLGIHHVWRSFALRARLDAANGNHKNHVTWRFGPALLAPGKSGLTLQSFLAMDKWLGAMKANTDAGSVESKIVSSRPPDAVDFCYLSTDATFANKVTDSAMCDTDKFLKPHSSPRQVAGGPPAENILKCQLKALDPNDYAPAVLTSAQLARLQAVFPTGVCEFKKPGVEQQPAVSPLDFSAGPGGVVLPAPPSIRAYTPNQ